MRGLLAVIERLEAVHRRSGYAEVGRAVEELRALEADARGFATGEPHVCTCGDCEVAPYEDRCRHEAALRRLLGGEAGGDRQDVRPDEGVEGREPEGGGVVHGEAIPGAEPCPTCRGTGGGAYNDCPTCGGNGTV